MNPTPGRTTGPSLQGKVTVVTGGASGIGLAIVERLVSEGARCVVFDIFDTEEVLRHLGGAALGLSVDISDEHQVADGLSQVVARHGRLDVVVNNAGVDGAMAPIAESPMDAFDAVMAVNVRGAFAMTKHALPYLIQAGSSSIINISSGTARRPTAGLAPYCASKAALITMAQVGAIEYAHANVRMNTVLPGGIETPLARALFEANPGFERTILAQHPLGRLGAPGDVAAAVAFLAGDDALFITGATFAVDGGFAVGS